jgi:arabinogalactan endo-1,4-beta-galactosidase
MAFAIYMLLMGCYLSNAQMYAIGADLSFMKLAEVKRIIMSVPDNRGIGIFWWKPAVARRGSRSFFDEKGNVLPVLTVFDKFTGK